MKRIIILLTSMFLLVGCIESIALISGGAVNGKVVQSSLQSAVSYGVKKKTGKTPLGHALNYSKEKKSLKEEKTCSSFDNKKDLDICLMAKEKIISNQANTKKKEFTDKPSDDLTSSLLSSINEKYKIKYLD